MEKENTEFDKRSPCINQKTVFTVEQTNLNMLCFQGMCSSIRYMADMIRFDGVCQNGHSVLFDIY